MFFIQDYEWRHHPGSGFCPRWAVPGSRAHHLPAAPGTHGKKKKKF
jgi:hypothetical protein